MVRAFTFWLTTTLLWIGIFATPTWAGVAVVAGQEEQAYAEKIQALLPADLAAQKDITVTVGPDALKLALANTSNTPIIAVGISRHNYEVIAASAPNRPLSAIYEDPHPIAQLHLIDILLGTRVKPIVSYLYTDNSESGAHLEELKKAATQLQLTLDLLHLENVSGSSRAFNRSQGQVLLMMPDEELYTQDNLRRLLLSAKRQNKYLVGNAKNFVRSGALATTYITPKDIACDIERQISSLEETGRLLKADYPHCFSIYVNQLTTGLHSIAVPENLDDILKQVVHDYE